MTGPSRAFHVGAAGLADLDIAIDILEEASSWAASIGHGVWEPGAFRDTRGRDYRAVRTSAERGQLYLADLGQKRAVATMTLQPLDPIFWPEAADDALYVHKLAVRRSLAGTGMGKMFIQWADDKAVQAGKKYVRLDTRRDNPVLRSYYEAMGFTHVGDLDLWFPVCLYERACGGVNDETPVG